MAKFVVAQYVVIEPQGPVPMIRAIDEEGVVWWIPENCGQGDWLRYIEEGGTVQLAAAPGEAPAVVPTPHPADTRYR